jgi:DNA-binding SARP family transcriptional activator
VALPGGPSARTPNLTATPFEAPFEEAWNLQAPAFDPAGALPSEWRMPPRAKDGMPPTLRFLGEMEISRAGSIVPLPPSRKTRALLAYLAVTGRAHTRERLCSLLWDVADDPRAALRWSLTRIRPLVDQPGRTRLAADRQGVRFEPLGAEVDVLRVRRGIAQGLDGLDVAALRRLAAEFRGEFLEGLELADFDAFQAWCVADRESARKAHIAVLTALLRRVEDDPAEAIPCARALVQIDPLGAGPRLDLIRLLLASGHEEEARRHLETGLRLLAEMGPDRAVELSRSWNELLAARRGGPGTHAAAPTPAGGGVAKEEAAETATPAAAGESDPAAPPLVGRDAELGRLLAALDEAARSACEKCVLVSGEPGIGKSRLLAELMAGARKIGCTLLEARSWEAESSRAYGPWMDALGRLPAMAAGPAGHGGLEPLLPGPRHGEAPADSREKLYGATVDFIAARASAAAPVVIAFDDVQWCDAASAELLHHVMRSCRHRRLLVVLAARGGEMEDNEAIFRLVRTMRRERILQEVQLRPLGPDDTARLASSVAPAADAARIVAGSGGNPLFALELARAERPARQGVPPTLSDLVRDRVARLPSDAAEVLRWAAVLGRTSDAGRLAALTDLPHDRLALALQVLVSRSLLNESGGFAHDVVRRVVSTDLSGPRRRLMHWKAARDLSEREPPEQMEERAAELARHAALGGDPSTAARACVAAGLHCLRVFAATEALGFARRGARHATELTGAEQVRRLIELSRVRLAARRPPRPEETVRELEELAERALDLGAAEHARLAFHLMGWLRWEEGDAAGARHHMFRAEAASRSGDERDRVVAIAEAARCLAMLQRDLGEAEAMVLEAAAMSRRLGREPMAIADASGMLRLHEGRLDEAEERFRRARMLAQRDRDPMGEFVALEHLLVLQLQRGDAAAAQVLSKDLLALGGRMREGSEAPFARALEALARYAGGAVGALPDLDRAIGELRAADAKQRLAYVLTRAAFQDLGRGDASAAHRRAGEALVLAKTLQHPTETAMARAALAQAADLLGRNEEAETWRRENDAFGSALLSHEARKAMTPRADAVSGGRKPFRQRRRSK